MHDSALLRRYSDSGSEDAFAALVQQCLPLVYGAALRRVGGDTHLAQDITQMVFTAVSRDAARLARHPNLPAWLFTTTRFLASKALRTERRRRAREHATWFAQPTGGTVVETSPALHAVLDDVLMELQQLDRDMLVMRFYRGLRLAEIGAQLNSSENAVQKRIERALDRLKAKLFARGITSTAAAIAGVFEAHGAVAVPAGLAAASTTAGLAGGVGGAAAFAAPGLTFAAKLPFYAVAALALAGSAGVVWYHRENERLRRELNASAMAQRAAAQRPAATRLAAPATNPPAVAGVAAATAPAPDARPAIPAPAPAVATNQTPAMPAPPIVPSATGSLVPLKIDYPRPLFAGTPRPVSVANLEPVTMSRAPLMVPAATRLLSKGRPVTSSDSLPVIGDLTFVTDGNKTGIDGTYLELGPGLQWIQIELEASALIHAVAVWHFHSQARVYHDVVVQISDDRDFKRAVTTLFNNDQDNTAKLGKGSDRAYVETSRGRVIAGRGEVGRYVRLYSNGNTSDELNHYCEVEVYGEPRP